MQKNWDRAAMRLTSARYLDREKMLEVMFDNGDRLLVAAETILPAADRDGFATSPDWSGLRVGETGDVLELPAGDAVIEIPWDRIRSVADPDFRAHWTDRAAERARRLGERVRKLRREAGLTRVALAGKLGLSREAIADLETGKLEPSLERIEQIALALGKPLRDFAEQ